MSLLPCHLPQAIANHKEGSDENNILTLMDVANCWYGVLYKVNPLKQYYGTYVSRDKETAM